MTIYPDEPRDVDTAAALLAAMVLFELGLLLLLLAAQLFIALIVLAVVLALLGMGGGRTLGCLSTLLMLPMRMIGWVWRPARELFQPALNRLNLRPVRAYRLQIAGKGELEFFVKGELAPQTLEVGSRVRVRTQRRRDRFYSETLWLLDPARNVWQPLAVAERSMAGPWLVAAIVLGLAVLYVLTSATGG